MPDIPLPASQTKLKQAVPDSISFFQSKVFRSGSSGIGNFEVLVHYTISGEVWRRRAWSERLSGDLLL